VGWTAPRGVIDTVINLHLPIINPSMRFYSTQKTPGYWPKFLLIEGYFIDNLKIEVEIFIVN
jgi:hypothetical protein